MVETTPSIIRPSPIRGRVLVFDSGAGGLTVAEEIRALGPRLTVDYAADTAFFPYGDKSDDALRERLPNVARALISAARPDVFVIACNTASTLALEAVRKVVDVPVVGTVPAIKPAAGMSQTKTIGLLATPGTIARDYTDRLIDDFAAPHGVNVVKCGSIDLVRLAEASAAGHTPPLDAFRVAQAPLFDGDLGKKIDTVVLACTHFPLVRRELQATAPQPVAYVDSGAAIARQTLRVLPDRSDAASPRRGRAYTTDEETNAGHLAPLFARFGLEIGYSAAPERRAAGNSNISADGR